MSCTSLTLFSKTITIRPKSSNMPSGYTLSENQTAKHPRYLLELQLLESVHQEQIHLEFSPVCGRAM